MVFFRFIRAIIKAIFYKVVDFIIRLLPIYYTNVNRISLYNWFKVLEKDLSYLYKLRIFKRVPRFFYKISYDMMFQFDNIDTTYIQKQANIALLRSLAARNNDKSIQFQADVMANELKQKFEKNTKKDSSLNSFIDYIELTFESIGMINPYKMSASRAFSLYHKAIDKNKRLESIYSK